MRQTNESHKLNGIKWNKIHNSQNKNNDDNNINKMLEIKWCAGIDNRYD